MTAREHYIAHMLLWKIHGGKMTYAFNMMQTSTDNQCRVKIHSRLYESLKVDLIKQIRIDAANRPPISDETRHKMSESHKGITTWNKGLETTPEKKKQQSDFMKEHNPMFQDEVCQKISESRRKRGEPQLTCPHCGKTMDARNAKRWHFDNCKSR